MADNTMCGQESQQWYFEQSRVEQQLSGGGPSAGFTFEALLDELLQKTNAGHTFLETRKGLWESHVKPNAVWPINVLINTALIYSLLISPSAVGSPVTVWHCWWPPEKCKTTLHSHGSPEAPSAKSQPTCQRTASGEHSGHFVMRCESCLQSTHAKRVDVYCRGDINI